MHHHKKGRKFGRTKNQRKAMLKNLATSLILHEKIQTTETKGKEVKNLVEKYINIGKKKDLAAKRRLQAFFPDKAAVQKITNELSEVFADRPSGFVRIARTGFRVGDSSQKVLVELLMPVKERLAEKAVKEITVTEKPKVTIIEKKAKPKITEKVPKSVTAPKLESESRPEGAGKKPKPPIPERKPGFWEKVKHWGGRFPRFRDIAKKSFGGRRTTSK